MVAPIARSIWDVSIPQAVRIACNILVAFVTGALLLFQYRKRYGLHAIELLPRRRSEFHVSIPQAVRIACNRTRSKRTRAFLSFQYRKRYGLHAICHNELTSPWHPCRFNTASGTDCMQYCLPKPLETVNPKGGFLILPPCLRFSPNRREFFCRKRRLKRGAKPAIPRKLLSTKKT